MHCTAKQALHGGGTRLLHGRINWLMSLLSHIADKMSIQKRDYSGRPWQILGNDRTRRHRFAPECCRSGEVIAGHRWVDGPAHRQSRLLPGPAPRRKRERASRGVDLAGATGNLGGSPAWAGASASAGRSDRVGLVGPRRGQSQARREWATLKLRSRPRTETPRGGHARFVPGDADVQD